MVRELSVSTCPACGKNNLCAFGLGQPAESCWCLQDIKKPEKGEILLPVPVYDSASREPASCYCHECLKKIKALKQGLQDQPAHPNRT
ncbi:cysteine-rich CWC family protein [Endozoicomonas sp. OPT23]|uniref:cysteine-rich CWC family protein n=1 Tax=Endozoicomonas sp. OPT23 TaxID=2072845 RepID=UPI001890ED3B